MNLWLGYGWHVDRVGKGVEGGGGPLLGGTGTQP